MTAPQQFDVIKLASQSASFCVKNMLLLYRLFWLPGLAFLVLFFSGPFLLAKSEIFLNISSQTAQAYLHIGIQLIGLMLFAPGMVRLCMILAGEALPTGLAYFRFGGREGRYVLAVLLWFSLLAAPVLLVKLIIGILVVSAKMVASDSGIFYSMAEYFRQQDSIAYAFADTRIHPLIGGIMIIMMGLATLFLFWFMLRSLVFIPMTAIENRIDFKKAFMLTKGNVWGLLFSVYIFHFSIALFMLLPMLGIGILIFSASGLVGVVSVSGGAGIFSILAVIMAAIIGFAALVLVIGLVLFYIAAIIVFPANTYIALSKEKNII